MGGEGPLGQSRADTALKFYIWTKFLAKNVNFGSLTLFDIQGPFLGPSALMGGGGGGDNGPLIKA